MPATQDKLHLVYTSDVHYVLFTEVSIRSAYVKAARPENLVTHVFDCGIPDADWDAFAKRLEATLPTPPHLVRHRIDMTRYQALRMWKGRSLATYTRLSPASILSNLDWILFVDGDTLFMDDPEVLLASRNENAALVGYLDTEAEENFKRPWYAEHGRVLLERKGPYVCCGVVLMNLKWFREHDAEARCLQLMEECPDAPFVDQDVLNIVCAGHTAILPEGWGTYGFLYWKHPIAYYKCIHYTGVVPWAQGFSWRVGYLDIAAVWVYSARVLMGLPIRDLVRKPLWQWTLGRAYTRLMGAAMACASALPIVGRRFMRYRALFFTRAERRRFYSPKYWEHKGR